MNRLTFRAETSGETYVVDHAVKGADYIHGYGAGGKIVVAYDGITDFSRFDYSGTYMEPSECLTEHCNTVRYCGDAFKRLDGTKVLRIFSGTEEPTVGEHGDIYLQIL